MSECHDDVGVLKYVDEDVGDGRYDDVGGRRLTMSMLLLVPARDDVGHVFSVKGNPLLP